MSVNNSLTTACLLQAFSDVIARHGGKVNDSFDDGRRLFVRSVLPCFGEAKANDRLQGGVAMKVNEGEVSIHPYVFRLVCTNGAIMAQSVSSRRLSGIFELDEEEAVASVRDAVDACCETEVLTNSMQQIRSSQDLQMDFALTILPMLARVQGHVGTRLMQEILKRCFEERDLTRFGLMNAVTSVARDIPDPELRWNLEELGGGIPVAAAEPIPQRPATAAARRRETAMVS